MWAKDVSLSIRRTAHSSIRDIWWQLSTQMVNPKSSIVTLLREGHRSFVN